MAACVRLFLAETSAMMGLGPMSDNGREAWHNFLKPPNLGHVMILAGWMVSLLISYGALSQKLTAWSEEQTKLENKVSNMDEHGTKSSSEAIKLAQMLATDHGERIRKTEEAIQKDSAVAGQIEVINEKIDRLRDDVRELKSRK
jgi:outer membrane murein-binding lipoprotein Lpp